MSKETIDAMKRAADLILTGGTVERIQAIALLQDTTKREEAQTVELVHFKQFLSDVLTAAGLVIHGKQCKALGERLSAGVSRYIRSSPPPSGEQDFDELAELEREHFGDADKKTGIYATPATKQPLSTEREALISTLRSLPDSYSDSLVDGVINRAADMLAADAQDWSRFHHLMKKHGLHPGRTDDDLLEILGAKLSELAQQVAVPQGWKLVPIEPTIEMYVAGDEIFVSALKDKCIATGTTYRTMLAAAPQPPQAERVPMTTGEKRAAWVATTIELPSQERCYLRGMADAEAHHGIGKKP